MARARYGDMDILIKSARNDRSVWGGRAGNNGRRRCVSAYIIPDLLSIENVRARRTGAHMFVDLTVKVPGAVAVEQSSQLEKKN